MKPCGPKTGYPFLRLFALSAGSTSKEKKTPSSSYAETATPPGRPEMPPSNPSSFSFIPPRSGNHADLYLPFWNITADVSGLPVRSYADLIRLANLPKPVQSAWEQEQPHFSIPAFKVQPNLFLRLARTMTFLEKTENPNAELPKSPLYPVTLPLGEAIESVKVLIASVGLPKKAIFPHLSELNFAMKDSRLVYLPFTLRGEELIQDEIGMSVQKAALSWGKLI
jgi:hypothetical protein